jgi:nitrite reductase (NADH) large subunit
MACLNPEYNGSIPSTQLKITGIDLYSAGDFQADEGALVKHDAAGYRKLVRADGKPKGAIVIGDAAAVQLLRKAMEGRCTLEECQQLFSE